MHPLGGEGKDGGGPLQSTEAVKNTSALCVTDSCPQQYDCVSVRVTESIFI